MMKRILQDKIHKAIQKLFPQTDFPLEGIETNYPPAQFGDYTTNVAMRLAGRLKRSPLEIAGEIAAELGRETDMFEKLETAKPGHVNIFLNPQVFVDAVGDVLERGAAYGTSGIGRGKTIMVEFGQPNTHKAFHVGHLRSAISGLAVVKMFEALGYKVIKANYFGDVGMHVAKTTWAMKKAGVSEDFDKWDVHERMKYIDQKYVEGSRAFKDDPAAQSEIRAVNKEIYEEKDTEAVKLYRQVRTWSLEHLEQMFKYLGVTYDRQYPESEVYKDAYGIVDHQKGKLLTKSQGAIIFDGSPVGLTTWVFLTKEGVPTYSAKDLALGLKKFSEYPELDQSIVTTSIEQVDYFKVIIHCLEQIDPALKGRYKHVPFGWLLRGHKKTSSRMGDTVKGIDVIEEAMKVAEDKITVAKEFDEPTKRSIIEKVALSGLKFLILSHEFQNNINYDPDEFIKLKGYCGPFILYSYVRTRSVLKKVGEPESRDINLASLNISAEERDLMKQILIFPDTVQAAAQQIAPHAICNHLYALAQKFNLFYEACPIQRAESDELHQFRLMLTKATGQVLKNGLNFLGIDTTEVM